MRDTFSAINPDAVRSEKILILIDALRLTADQRNARRQNTGGACQQQHTRRLGQVKV